MKIGIVSEGMSDYRVLKHIAGRYLKQIDPNIQFVPLQPKETPRSRQEGFGGWQKVFTYIKGDEGEPNIITAFEEGVDFIIVQIDTDVRSHYDVDCSDIDKQQLWNAVKAKLIECTSEEIDISKLLFAITIHSTECWLIPFVETNVGKCGKIDACVNTLNNSIRATDYYIDPDNKNNEHAQQVYDFILKRKKKKSELLACAQYNKGFELFLQQLDVINQEPQVL